MRKKIVSIVMMMLLLLGSFSIIVSAGSEENPEVKDRKLDVLFLGILPFFPQMNYKNADFESVWFYEQESNPEYLYVSMKIRDLYDS